MNKSTDGKAHSSFEDEYKSFKFTSKIQLESLRKEFGQLTVSKPKFSSNLDSNKKLERK